MRQRNSKALILTGSKGQARWRVGLVTEYPATAVPGEALRMLAKLASQKAGNALRILVACDSPLVPKELMQAITVNKIQGGALFGGALTEVDSTFTLSALPLIKGKALNAGHLETQQFRHRFTRAFGLHRQRLVATVPMPPTGLWTLAPVKTAQSLTGLRIRTYDALSQSIFQMLGANASNLPFAQIEAALSDKRIEGVLSSGDGAAGKRLSAIFPHYLALNYAIPVTFLVLNESTLADMPHCMQRGIIWAGAETERRYWEALSSRTQSNYQRLRDNGIIVQTDVPPCLAHLLQDAAHQCRWQTLTQLTVANQNANTAA